MPVTLNFLVVTHLGDINRQKIPQELSKDSSLLMLKITQISMGKYAPNSYNVQESGKS
jgi:hypothetical protein